MKLILASTSAYRQQLLIRLGLPFELADPKLDETPVHDESPASLAQRLAAAKAANVSTQFPGAWVIGSDQVAEFDNQAIGKPGSRTAAIAQLQAMSGHEVRFLTAVALARTGDPDRTTLDITRVRFRHLSKEEIERYIDREPAFDCAGSFKSEGLGITLFEQIQSTDPTALIGLPLIATAQLLREAGFLLP